MEGKGKEGKDLRPVGVQMLLAGTFQKDARVQTGTRDGSSSALCDAGRQLRRDKLVSCHGLPGGDGCPPSRD